MHLSSRRERHRLGGVEATLDSGHTWSKSEPTNFRIEGVCQLDTVTGPGAHAARQPDGDVVMADDPVWPVRRDVDAFARPDGEGLEPSGKAKQVIVPLEVVLELGLFDGFIVELAY